MQKALWTADAYGRHGESDDWGAQWEWMEEVAHYRKYMKYDSTSQGIAWSRNNKESLAT